MKKKLSAMMDGELSEHEQARVLAELSRDPELKKTWERFQIIRAALNKELDAVVSVDLGDRIAEGIRELPPLVSDRKFPRQWRPATRWVSTMALAASVAVVAITGVRWFSSDESQPAPEQIAVAPGQQPNFIRAGLTRWDTVKPEHAKLLNTYLIEHHEFTPTTSMNGVMAYGRFVGYDSSP